MTQVTVAPADAGARLDRFLAAQPAIGSRALAERLIAAGDVLVDGSPRAKSHRLEAGSRVAFTRPSAEPAPEPVDPGALGVRVAFRDPYLLVVDKPAGLVVHAAPGVAGPTLMDALAGQSAGGDDPARPGLVHRLDRDTSGLLVVARDDETHRRLGALLRRRRVERTYLALVRGRPPSRRGTVEAPVGRDRRVPTRMGIDTEAPRDAVTHFELAEALRGRTLLRVTLETGRTHQIRVHLAAIGHPVVGDPVYGHGPELGLGRQFLHAARLRFPHPHAGDPVDVSAPLPADLDAALGAARAGG